MKDNINNWLLLSITIMVSLVTYIYVSDATANTKYQEAQAEALQKVVNELIELRISNTGEHRLISKTVETHTGWTHEIYDKEINPNSKWRIDGDKRLTKVESKIGIY